MLSMSVSKLTAAPLPDPHGVRRHGHRWADSDPQGTSPPRRARPAESPRHGRPGRQEPARRPSASYTVSRDVMWVNRSNRPSLAAGYAYLTKFPAAGSALKNQWRF